MSVLKSIIICFSFLTLSPQSLKLNDVRDFYKTAAQDKHKVAAFYEMLAEVQEKDGVALYAYKCAAMALKARHAKTIKAKKEGFKEGVTNLETLIQKYPNKVEPRFIRLSIQENAPKILRYKTHVKTDKIFILKQYPYIKSKSLRKHIKDYILQSKSFNDQEKALILDS